MSLVDSPAVMDRTAVSKTGSRALRRALHAQTAALKAQALRRRRELAAPLLDGPEVMSRLSGLGSQDLAGSPLVQAARAEAYRLVEANGDKVQRAKGSVQYLLENEAFESGSAAVKLACSPEILGPVARYLGMLPILLRIEMTRANATTLLPNSTHRFHLDPEDITQVKAFIHLTPVDPDCGPFTALPANLSDEVVEHVGYREGRLTDEEVDAIVGAGRAVQSIGPPGTVTFCDTSRCFHFGGRPAAPGKPKRDLLVIDYVLPTCAMLPRFAGDGKRPALMEHLGTRDDETWNALIGAIYD